MAKRAKGGKKSAVVAEPLPTTTTSPAPSQTRKYWHGLVGGITCLGLASLVWMWIASSSTDAKPEVSPIAKIDQPEPTSEEEQEEAGGEVCSRCSGQVVDDPSLDGWDTEVFNRAANRRLKALAKLLAHPKKLDLEHLQPLVTADVTATDLRPRELKETYHGPAVVVQRPGKLSDAVQCRGARELVGELKRLTAPWKDASSIRVKFKLFTVEKAEDWVTTRQYLAISGHTSGGSLEQNATWVCRWQPAKDGKPPLLQSITVNAFEQVSARSSAHTLLADCTESVLGANASLRDQLLPGADAWNRKSVFSNMNCYQGCAIGDVNGDGLEDLYVCQMAGLPNRLFIRNPDGTLTDESDTAGVNWLEPTRSALFLDVDNDGDQDLIVGTYTLLLLMENDGAGLFHLRDKLKVGKGIFSMAAADYDRDGLIDIYVCNYYPSKGEPGIIAYPVPYHDANNGGQNVLYRNLGKWRFKDVTKEVGMDLNNSRYSLAASWEDFDNDGDLDIYVSNDFGRNNLYRNDGRRFIDVASYAGVEDQSFGMSITWGDYNRDGLMDMYVSNMFSGAGNRITYQRQFKQGTAEDIKDKIRYLARGNSLFTNNGDGTFRDVSHEAGVMMGRWSWGSVFMDINNDGWEDLLVANGYITRESSKDL